jgi:hypothetical protein
MSDNTISNKAGTVIRACTCTSPYQDGVYGQGLRVFNLSAGKKKGNASCTVCGRFV